MAYTARRAVTAIAALLLAFAPVLGLLPFVSPIGEQFFVAPAAEAFYPSLHFEIFQNTVGSQFSEEARGWVNEGLEYNDTLSVGQFHPEWHFDSAKDPADICALWMAHDPGKKMGPNRLLVDAAAYAVEAFRQDPTDPSGPERVGAFRREALFAYGQYLHAIQDFYTHTNWIELHVATGKQPGVAPIQKGCDAAELAALQPRLQSGYFDFRSAPVDYCGGNWVLSPGLINSLNRLGLAGALRPPAGFDYCHGPPQPAWFVTAAGSVQYPPELRLAKDLPDHYHGAETFQLPGGPVTKYHDEAVRLATLATPETLQVLHDRVVPRLATDLPDRDAECLFLVLLKGGDPACPKRVGLGSIYHGEALAVDDSALAPWEDYPDYPGGPVLAQATTALRNVRASIEVEAADGDDAVRFITGGSLTFEINAQDGGGTYAYTATQARGVIRSVADGYGGMVDFTGTMTFNQPDGSPTVFSDHLEAFGLAVDAAGEMVLCPPLPGPDPVQTYQDCLARAVVRLKPAQSPPIA